MIANINDLTTFLSIITAVCGSYLILFIGFFFLDFIGWLDFSSDSFMRERQNIKRQITNEEAAFTLKNASFKSMLPRAKLMFPNQFEMKKETHVNDKDAKEISASEKEAVGYVNELFNEILDQVDDKNTIDSGKVVVSAEINNQEDTFLKSSQLLPTIEISGKLSSFKPNQKNVKENKHNTSIKMEATVL